MPGLNANEIRVAGTGSLYVAPAHTPAPAISAAVWPSPWVDLGYTSSDGVKFVKKDKLDPIDTWQSVAAIRYVFSDRDFSVKFSLLQVNSDTLPFFFSSPAPGTTNVYEIAAAPRVDERALGIEFSDGPVKHRFYIPRGVVTETDETSVTRTSAIKLGITFTAMTPIKDNKFEPLAQWFTNVATPAAAAETGEEQEQPA